MSSGRNLVENMTLSMHFVSGQLCALKHETGRSDYFFQASVTFISAAVGWQTTVTNRCSVLRHSSQNYVTAISEKINHTQRRHMKCSLITFRQCSGYQVLLCCTAHIIDRTVRIIYYCPSNNVGTQSSPMKFRTLLHANDQQDTMDVLAVNKKTNMAVLKLSFTMSRIVLKHNSIYFSEWIH